MTVATTQINVSSRESHLAEGSAPWTIHGVAIGADDVTKGSSGIKKFWPAEELQEAAESLEGRPLVVDHDNSAAGVVGRITKAGWKDGVGVIYEAELYDEDYAENVDNGLLEVSVRGYHIPVEEMDRRPEDGAKVVENIEFDNLSIVPKGAAPSNTLKMGEHSELEAAELSAALSDMESVESGWNYLDGVTIARHQQTNGNSVVIDRVKWPHFDFVLRVYKFHEEARDYTEKLGHVQLEAGEHEDVEVELYEPLEDGTHELQLHLHEHSHVEEEGGNGIGPHSQDDNPTVENMYVAVGESAELAEWTTGDWVQWGDKQGIILVGPELDDQDEPLVESYEETDDGEWYPTGEEETVSTQSLSEWDVDEDDITTAPDDDDSDDEEENSPENELDFDEGDRVSWHSGNGVVTGFVKGELLVEPYAKDGDVWTATGFEVEVHPTDAETWNVSAEYIDTRGGGVNLETEFTSGDMVTWEDGSEGEVEEVSTDESFDILPDVEPEDDDPIAKILVYEDGEPSDGNFVVAHFSELDSVEEEDTEEAESGFTEGDGVQWESSGGTAVGQVIGRKEDGCYSDEVDGNVEVCAPEDGAVLLIEVHRDGEGTGVHVAHHEDAVSEWDNGADEEENMLSVENNAHLFEYAQLGHRPEGSEEPLSGKDTKDQPHRYPYCEHDCPEVDCEECAELSAEVRTPDFGGTKESTSWSGHSLSDFTSEDWDDLSESEQRDIAGHFLVSRSGWPPETFGDLAFEVVDTDGSLDLQGLRAAKTRVGSAGDDIPKAELRDTIDRLANDNFDVEWNDEEENSMKTGDVPMRDAVQRGSNKPSKKVVKRYLYEKGKADGMYDEMSPLRGDSENEYDDEDEDMDEEDDEELSYGELSSREYEHEEIDAYENGYKDGRKRASEMEDSEYEDEEMREAYSKGAHDGMDPDEPDNAAEAGAHMPDEEQAAYADGHEVGRKEAQNNELPFEPGNGDEEEEDEELAEDMYESEEDAEAASEDLPEPCESGTAHYHEDDDMYMPCASHEQYQEAVEGEEASAYPCTKNGGDARDSDDLREVKVAESKAGLAVLSDNRIMTNTAELEDYDNPVVMEQGEFEELQSMNENIEELRARTDILDSVERELVEELADSDEPLVIEEARFEELEQEAEHVKGLYAEELAEQVGVFSKEELMDKNTLEELREKYEEVGGDIEEELTANPQGGDPTEDELSEGDDTGTQETEELAEEKRNDLREKLGLGGN